MEFYECMQTRRSIRKYTNEAVSAEQIRKIVAAAQLAPSWKNSQSVRFTAITDPELKEQIAQTGVFGFRKNCGIISGAPVLIVLSTAEGISGFDPDGSPSTEKGGHWQSFDAGIAAYAFCLAANEEGFGTCIMGLYDEKRIADIISLPAGQSISALIALGRPAENPGMPKRKETDEILRLV